MVGLPKDMRRHRARSLVAWLLTLGLAAVPAPVAAQSTAPVGDPVVVVATMSVLADLVAQAGGERVQVSSLVPRGGEVHTFDPSPSDAAAVANADLIVMNGLGLDEWLTQLISDAGAGSVPVVRLAEGLDGVTYLASGAGADAAASPGAGADGPANPHLWLDATNAQRYVERIRGALDGVDPAGSAAHAASAAAYLERLGLLEADILAQMATIPEANRTVVSLHDAFPYFAAAYGLTIAGSAIANPGAEPSAQDVAALIDQIRALGAAAILAESQLPDDLVDLIAGETGIPVVTGLYTDSLGDPPADTYEGLMRWNVQQVVSALR